MKNMFKLTNLDPVIKFAAILILLQPSATMPMQQKSASTNISEESTYICTDPRCGVSCPTQDAFSIHMRAFHAKPRYYYCAHDEECPKFFSDKNDLKKHIIKEHMRLRDLESEDKEKNEMNND